MTDSSIWDDFVRAHPRAHLLQLSAWATLKAQQGWTSARALLHDSAGNLRAGAQILFKPLPLRRLGLGTLAYLPFAPLWHDEQDAPALWAEIRRVCRQHRAAFLKVEAGIYQDAPAPNFAQWGLRPSPQTIQPPRTILIDLARPEDAILAGMNQGTRRKIRQSLKGDVVYQTATPAQVQDFAALMQVTGERNAFGVHETDYYQRAYELFVPRDAALCMAYRASDGQALAGVFVASVGKTAWYLYGASSSEGRNLMASYGVQWQAIQWARARDCTQYDMWGIPDEDEATLEANFQQREDGLWGVYGFKRGWGGQVVRSLGALDLPYRPLLYAGYQVALKLRR